MKQDPTSIECFCLLCILTIVMVMVGHYRRWKQCKSEPYEPDERELPYETEQGWIQPPPIAEGTKQWGVHCTRSSECAYPWRCNSLYCDIGSRSFSR